ncbi:MAG: membrane protein insertase YidC [Treponema sp.]|jgi:YidC/Oxa1 family membrane protein insertase|nr:membrane protein insertase YidC [Treponema sp.]
MEKNTILAVVLSTVVLVGFYLIQGVFFPPPVPEYQPPPVTEQFTPQADTQTPPQSFPEAPQAAEIYQTSESLLREDVRGTSLQDTQRPSQTDSQAAHPAGAAVLQYITVDTELVTIVLTNAGGDLVSWKLKEHWDNHDNVDMILSGINEARAFSIALGGLDAQPINSLFSVNRISEYSVEFYRDFQVPSQVYGMDGVFRLIKRYDFKPNDYMFELTVTLDGGFSMQGFNFSGSAYTLSFGPQIGPVFEKLDNRYEYREYLTFANGKRKKAKLNESIDTRPAWAAIAGKYFTFIAIPYLAQYTVNFSERAEPGLSSASRLNIVRPAANSSRTVDTYRFYLGPKTQNVLVNYNNGKNEFGLKDTNLIDVVSTRGILAPLENALKWLLLVFYRFIPNYGIAIILLTLLVKILFFPLTKKGSEATLRMQALAPKIKEIQDKYKSNPQKMQTEMGNFYKTEGYNPLSGCLPLLLQIPIFFAMYNLFNNHFDLRGAMFIPGWIPDLSVPEAIWNFPGNFKLPFLGWNALRLLPFIYVGSQLLYGKVTQIPGQQTNAQMKMMLYVMPIVFFFILYDVPSGLLIYWIFSNLLTMAQQVIINKYVMAKRAQAQQQSGGEAAKPGTPSGGQESDKTASVKKSGSGKKKKGSSKK